MQFKSHSFWYCLQKKYKSVLFYILTIASFDSIQKKKKKVRLFLWRTS